MLQAIRERMIGWILWVVIGFICVPFAFWGIESFRGGTGDPVVAKVGGSFGGLIGAQRITESQLRQAYERRYRQMQQLMGENFRPEMIDPKQFQQIVLNDMIKEMTLRQYSERQGYVAPDSMLVEAVREMPAFQDNGQFSAAVYKERLSREGYSTARFETEMRDSLAIDQMRSGVTDTEFATDADLAAAYRLSGQQRTLSYVQLEAAKYQDSVKVEDAQVQAYYDAHKSEFMSPERIKLAYVELSLEQMQKAQSPGPDVLKALYESEKATRFSTPEERKASHILIAFGADKAAARKHAEELSAKLKGGADFATLAKAESTDTGSKGSGGDLGWIRHGQMVPKFEEALMALKKGEVSEPVETEFGWHLIKLEDVHPPAIRQLDDKTVQAELLELYQRKEGEKHFKDQQEKLEQLAFENPGSLEPLAKELGVEVKTTDWFGRAGAPGSTGVTSNQAVRQAAFSEEVLKSNENSKPISIGTGDVVVVRKAEYEAPRQRELTEVAEQIKTKLRTIAVAEKAKEQGRAVQEALRSGKKPEEAAQQVGAQLKTIGPVKRDDAKVDKAILKTLFHLPRPAGGTPSVEQVVLANGDVAVVILSDVKDGDLATATPDEAKKLRASLRDLDAGRAFNAFRDHIGDVVKVKIVRAPSEAPDEPAP